MKASEFRVYSSNERLSELVEATLRERNRRLVHEVVPHQAGEVYRDFLTIEDMPEIIWKKINSPSLFSHTIPGLESFSTEGKKVGSRVREKHNMIFSVNPYEGIIFHYDESARVWGMSNHPTTDENPFDIPHNVVYHHDRKRKTVNAGVEYAASGAISQTGVLKPFVAYFAKTFNQLALERVEAHILREALKLRKN